MDYKIRMMDAVVAEAVSLELAEATAQAIANVRAVPVDVEGWGFLKRFTPQQFNIIPAA